MSAVVPTRVFAMFLCDRCEALLEAEADTYPEALERLQRFAEQLGWYIVERAAHTNGSARSRQPKCDLCPACYVP